MNTSLSLQCERSKHSLLMWLARKFAIWVLPTMVIFGLLVFAGRDELLATFSIGSHRVLNIYAESEFHYEPPGYLYFEIKQWEEIRVPRRRFMGVGAERKPQETFALISCDNDEVIALLLDNDVHMIHEFESGFTWPGWPQVTEFQLDMTEILLRRLRQAHPNITCSRQAKYRESLNRLPKKEDAAVR